MRSVWITVHLLAVSLEGRFEEALAARRREPQRGSVTIEQVAWAAAVIAIVAIAVAAIRAYVTSQVGRL